MAGSEKNSPPADVWLIEGGIDGQSVGGDWNSNDWLATGVDAPEKSKREPGSGVAGKKDANDARELQTKLRDGTRRIEELESELAKAKRQLAAAKKRAAGKSTARAERKPAGKAKDGKIDLNKATFEDLRGLGLAVTQSARLIAQRDVRGGFQSLAELEDVSGLSEKTLTALKGHLQLAT